MDVELEIAELPPGDRAGHEAYAALWNAVVPRYPITPDELERNRARRPDDVRLVGRIDWAVAGCAAAIRSDLPGRTYMGNVVLPEHRRRGLGRAFLERIVVAAREHGSDVLAAGIEEGDEAGEAFAARFGLREVLRELEISRRIGPDEPDADVPDGVELVELATRADLLRETYELASETLPEMPMHAPFEMPSFERWVEEDATGPDVLPGGTLVALAKGRVVGFSGLVRRAADPHLAEHGLTFVAASHRNRGIATALKHAQIAWASRNGFRELQTSTQDANAPMRAVNDKLGYEPLPAWIRFEAPLDEVEETIRHDAERRRATGGGAAE
jgi:mycothiol synthase